MHSVCRSISKDLRGKMRLEELVLFLVMFSPYISGGIFFPVSYRGPTEGLRFSVCLTLMTTQSLPLALLATV